MKRTHQIDMTSGSLVGKIILFSLPLMASGALQLLYNAADNIIVGKLADNGEMALAAVGATGPLINLIINVVIGLSVGTAVVVARYIGEEDREGASRATHTSVTVSVIAGLIVGVFGFVMSPMLLEAMGTVKAGGIFDMAVKYMRIYFIGAPANMLYNYGSAVLRAGGDTKRPLYFLTVSGVINIILNLFFVIVLKMDVDGVAIATVISQVVSAVLVVICLMKSEGPCKLKIKRLKIHFCEMKKITLVGLPAGLQGSLFSMSNVIIQSSFNALAAPELLGPSFLSGNTAAAGIEGFVNVAENAFYHATITFTGQNYGARKYKRTRKVFWICVAMTAISSFALGALAYLFGEPLLEIYIKNSPVAIEFGMIRMSIVVLTHFILGVETTVVGQLRGLGYSFSPMVISIFGICGFRIFWVYTVFAGAMSRDAGVEALKILYMSYPISWAITLAAMLVLYFFAVRKLPQDGDPPPEHKRGRKSITEVKM